jgi:hypothetical protein
MKKTDRNGRARAISSGSRDFVWLDEKSARSSPRSHCGNCNLAALQEPESSARASFKSRVSNPSVNQPQISASLDCTSWLRPVL